MVRVLHIVPSLDVNAGMLSVVMSYYRHIDRDRVQFDFLYLFEEPNNHLEEIKALGGRAFCMGAPSYSAAYVKKIDSFFAEHEGEYEILHCHPLWTPVLFAEAAKKHGVRRVITHSHSTQYSEKKLSAIRNRAFLPIIKAVSTDFCACSEAAAGLFRLGDGRVSIVKNAIEVNKYRFSEKARQELRQELGIDGAALVLGHIGRFSVEKNHAFLLEVFEKLAKIRPEARLLLVGDGALRAKIENIAAERGISDKILFTGVRQDVEKLLSAMDVFLLPSIFEGVPVAALEAQAAGLKCLISDGVTREIALTDCEYLSLDSEPWVAALKDTVPNANNRAEANRRVSESDFNIKKAAKSLEDFYLS